MCVNRLPNLIFRIGGFYGKNVAATVDSCTPPDIFVNLLNVREIIVKSNCYWTGRYWGVCVDCGWAELSCWNVWFWARLLVFQISMPQQET